MTCKHPELSVLCKCCYAFVRRETNLELVMGVILLLTTTPTLAQFKSGTIIVVGYSKHKVVIAADSRGGEEDGTYRDDRCKITALNDEFLFAPSGRIVDVTNHVLGWDAADQARAALATILNKSRGTTNPHLAGDVADLWVQLIGRQVTDHIRPQEFASLKSNRLFVDGIFIALGATEPQVAYAVLRRDADTTKFFSPPIKESTGMPDKTVFTAVGGESPTFVEFLNNTSARAKKEQLITARLAKAWKPKEADARMAIRLVDLVIRYSPNHDVGRPVDAADLTVGQTVHWIQRKRNCE